jgi:hypothetical protein
MPIPASKRWRSGGENTSSRTDRQPDTSCHPPPPDLGEPGYIDLGQTVTGNICYEIASDDASTLLLSGLVAVGGSVAERQVRFALR